MTAELERGKVAAECTCGPGAWGTCDQCGVDAWVKHYCPFPCDDVTCENGSLCIGCLTGRPCPMHNGDDWDNAVLDDEDDWEDGVVLYGRPVLTLQPLGRYL